MVKELPNKAQRNVSEANMALIQIQSKQTEFIQEKLESSVRSTILRFKNYRLYLQTVSELEGLSVRELADLGLSRSMIRNVAYQAVYEGGYDRKEKK